MFAFGPQFHMHSCNPFGGATIANPRINFALGVAAATAMPMYSPCLPVFGFGFCNPYAYTPMFNPFYVSMYNSIQQTNLNLLLSQNYINNYNQYNYNNLNSYNSITNYCNSITTNTSNPFLKLDNITTVNPFLSNTKPTNSSSNNNKDNTKINTSGTTLNRNNADYGPEFLAKVKEIAGRLNCDYRDLLGLMNSESGIDSTAKNPKGTATGLIQFVESTANSLGTTTAALRRMKPIDQLDYVEKYLANAKANAGITGKLSAGDLYSLVFLPGRAHREVLTSSGEKYYAHNSGLDLNKDGKITKSELSQRVYNKRVSDNSFLA